MSNDPAGEERSTPTGDHDEDRGPGLRAPAIPADDGVRQLARAAPDDPALRHIAMVGDTYTILLSGRDTADRFALIDMYVPEQGGPPPHRHDFEETFHVLEGTLEVTVREATSTIRAGETANIPANVLHSFSNAGDAPVRMLCIVAPAGLEEFFAEVGQAVPTRTSPAPELTPDEQIAQRRRAGELSARYRVDISGS
jgi:quercetin dioxygenase-like cupin family protein